MEKVGEKIKIGICVLQKKVLAMEELLKRLESFGEFEIIRFGDKIILEDPVERWPLCDCLIAFYSTGFPLKKAEDYAALRQPFLINDLEQQHHLHDRRDVYKRLASCGVPVPRHAAVIREFPFQELPNFFEDEDYIKIDGNEFWKPFIEKPVDSEDHNIRIYYPRSAGGGMKELFRKVGDQSSSFHPDVNKVRRGGSFIYEDFLATGGKDIKVYTVGEDYAHAEARKSPVVDGKVIRSNDGKEVRFPILLRQREKEMAKKVVIAFDQAVCGFDILRTERCSYVCDVNGWSFVKNSEKYYDDAVYMLRKMCLDAKAHTLSTSISRLPCIAYDQPSGGQQTVHLRCMIAIIRHGDRTPKQKVKLEVTEEIFLQLMIKYNGGSATSEAKLKTAMQLQEVLNVLKDLVQCPSGSDIITEVEQAEKLRQIQNVLEEGGCFSGINRKVQIKPSKWIKIAKGDGESEIEQPVEALMVVKYGGVLTGAGKKQAEELGRYFRNEMYPGDGLLRLHSMYQHELKIYSSSEGRVQMSAAGFAKGFLNLDGELTPILVSLVSRDYSILEGLNSARIEMAEAKAQLNNLIVYGERDDSAMELSNTPWMTDGAGLPTNVSELLQKLVRLTKEVTEQVRLLADDHSSAEVPCGKEGLFLMYARWRKLESDLYNERKKRFDISKIADLYDCCKYDLIHNAHLKLHGLLELFRVAQMLAAGVTSNEYGINPTQKLKIGTKIARRLVNKILRDLKNTRDETFDFGEFENHSDNSLCEDEDCFVPKHDVDTLPQVRTRLYFTSESHIHSLLNVLRYANLHESLRGEDGLLSFSGLERLYKTKELDFMSGIVLRMFEDSAVPSEDPRRFRVEMSFTRGADSSLLEKDEEIREHRLPIVGLESLQEVGSYLTLEHLETILANAVKTEEQPKEQKSKKRGHHVTNE